MHPDFVGMHELERGKKIMYTVVGIAMLNQHIHTTVEKKGDKALSSEQIFNSLYTGFYDKVCRAAYMYCGTHETAKDLTQDVFMKVLVQMDRLTGKINEWKSWESYLYVIARNEALNYRRKSAREVKRKAGYCRTQENVFSYDPVLEKECEAIFNKAIKKLTKRQSEVYVLSFYGLKIETIAEKLGVTYSTVNNTLQEARRKVRGHVCEQLILKIRRKELSAY
jgi:RNA polymerase sigma-70 factor (ECF subfamily)